MTTRLSPASTLTESFDQAGFDQDLQYGMLEAEEQEEKAKERGEGKYKTTFRGPEDFGRWLIENERDAAQAYKDGYSVEEIGQIVKDGSPEYKDVEFIEGYADVDYGRAFTENPTTDWLEVAEEEVGAIGEMISHPWETTKGVIEFGGGLFDELTEWSPETRSSFKNSLVSSGFPAELADALVDQFEAPHMMRPGARGEAREVIDTMAERFSPPNIQRNPYEATSDIAQIAGSLGAGGAIKTGLKATMGPLQKSRMARATAKLGELAIDPAGAVVEGPMTALRFASPHLKKIKKGGTDRLRSFSDRHKLSQGDSGLFSEAVSGALGFTTSLGARYIENLGDRADSYVRSAGDDVRGPSSQRWVDVFRDTRSMDIQDSSLDVLTRSYRAMDEWRSGMKSRYTGTVGPSFQDANGKPIKINAEHMMSEFPDVLGEFGFEIKTNKDGSIFKDKDGRMKVIESRGETVDDVTTITRLGSDRATVKSQFEMFLNVGDHGRWLGDYIVRADELHKIRLLLDDDISKLGATAEGASSRTRALLSSLRDTVRNELEMALPDEYAAEMAKYTEELELMQRADAELGLRPGMMVKGRVSMKDVKGAAEKLSRDRPKLTGNDITLEKLGRVFNEKTSDSQKLPLLETIQDFAKDETLIPALMGLQASPLFGSGLVVRSEISQSLRNLSRHITMIGTGIGAGLEFGALGLPSFMLFSPRLMSEAIVTLLPAGKKGYASARKGIMSNVRRLKNLDDSVGGRFSKQAMASGMNAAQYIERVESQAGVNLGGEVSEEAYSRGPDVSLSELAGIKMQSARQDALSGMPSAGSEELSEGAMRAGSGLGIGGSKEVLGRRPRS